MRKLISLQKIWRAIKILQISIQKNIYHSNKDMGTDIIGLLNTVLGSDIVKAATENKER